MLYAAVFGIDVELQKIVLTDAFGREKIKTTRRRRRCAQSVRGKRMRNDE